MQLLVERKLGVKKYFIQPKDNSYQRIEWRFASSGMQTSASIPTLVDYFAHNFSFKDAIKRSIVSYLYENDNLRQYKSDMEPMDMKKVIHIHIEEPEQNLFPSAQMSLMEEIVQRAFASCDDGRQINLMMATHSPYITNYVNLLINRHLNVEKLAALQADSVAVYLLFDGHAQDLVATDENGTTFVDTYDLVEPMESIMREYQTLTDFKS